jgi:hypothetical protein
MGALNGGMEVKNGAVEGFVPVVADSHHFDEEQVQDPLLSESRIRIHIKVKILIRICITAMRIHSPGTNKINFA